MLYFIWLGLAVTHYAIVARPVVDEPQSRPVVQAPPPVLVETFTGQTPREHSPAYQKWLEADRAFEVIDVALGKVWEIPDPRDPLAELIRCAAEVDPIRACDRIRTVSVRLQKLRLQPARRVTWDSFAMAAAPQDRDIRDALLRLAVGYAGRALADHDLWRPDPVPPGSVAFGDRRRLREFERQLLEYQVRLWQAILEQKSNRAKAIELVKRLLKEAKQKGLIWLGCIGRTFDGALEKDLADLDPHLFLAVASEMWPKEHVAQFCATRAYSRWLDRQKDAFTGVLVKYAVENGTPSGDVMRVYSRYEFQKAWERVAKHGTPGLLITDLAWRDPEAALSVAEREPRLAQQVAKVWAYKKPDQIERVIKYVDNEYWRPYFRNLAREELEWRQKGNPARDTPELMPDPFRSHPEPPAGTPWVPPAALQKLLDDPKCSAEADKWLHKQASQMGWGPPDHAVEMIKGIKSPHLLVDSATWLARGLIRRSVRE